MIAKFNTPSTTPETTSTGGSGTTILAVALLALVAYGVYHFTKEPKVVEQK